jgi:hypothetical protein
LFRQYLDYFEKEVLAMAWYLSEEYIFFSTPGFDASFSPNASHDKSMFVFTAKMALHELIYLTNRGKNQSYFGDDFSL